MKENIPVFIHVPKNGGTYIYNSIKSAGRFFLGRMCCLDPSSFSDGGDFRFVYYCDNKFPLREINIQEDGKTIFTIFSTDRVVDFAKKNNLSEFDESVYYLDLLDERIKNIISCSDIFTAIIQPRGLKYLKSDVFENFFYANDEIVFKFYFPLRDPVERLKSLFFYLKSENSKHEPTHAIYKSNTFEDFIINEAPDNWIVSQLCKSESESQQVTQDDFLEASRLIDKKNFLFFDVREIDKMIDASFRKYGFSFIQDVPEFLKTFLSKFNSNNRNNWLHEASALDKEETELYAKKLNQKTKYEYELYKLIYNYKAYNIQCL